MKGTVFVGLSGGVDSAVSAALLKREGFDVVGAFIKIWQPTFFECSWEKDRMDAMRVCVALGIPFCEVDLSDAYKRAVIDDMVAAYAAGATPNPDVLCNEKIKFGSFFEWALGEGAAFVATGHYARIAPSGGSPALHRSADTEKDQTYFLYRIPRAALSRVLFPVGGLAKSAVRSLAAAMNLPVSKKPDSQGLCFVGDVSMPEFLSRYMRVTPGDVVDASGERLGRHEGAALYTVGQRHGFSVKGERAGAPPHYVSAVDTASNTITVSADKADCMRTEVLLDAPHMLADVGFPCEVMAQSRYRETPFPVRIERGPHGYRALFETPRLVASGQSLVVYDGAQCLGGAVMR